MPEKWGSVNWYIQVNTKRLSQAARERIQIDVNLPRMAAVSWGGIMSARQRSWNTDADGQVLSKTVPAG